MDLLWAERAIRGKAGGKHGFRTKGVLNKDASASFFTQNCATFVTTGDKISANVILESQNR